MNNKLDWIYAEALVAEMLNLGDDYDISFEQFHEIDEMLIKFTPVQVSPLTDKKYRGFVDKTGTYFIAKVDA
jgi:hypothetical protein